MPCVLHATTHTTPIEARSRLALTHLAPPPRTRGGLARSCTCARLRALDRLRLAAPCARAEAAQRRRGGNNARADLTIYLDERAARAEHEQPPRHVAEQREVECHLLAEVVRELVERLLPRHRAAPLLVERAAERLGGSHREGAQTSIRSARVDERTANHGRSIARHARARRRSTRGSFFVRGENESRAAAR